MPVATAFVSPPLGHSIPYLTPHAVSVSLPTWQDNVGYEEGEKRVVDSMQTGYPRFFVHRSIQKLAAIANQNLAINPLTDKCYLYPTLRTACSCVAFLESRKDPAVRQEPYYRRWTIASSEDPTDAQTIYAVFTHADDFGLGKQFWQHTGDGISSRLSERCLALLDNTTVPASEDSTGANGQNTATTARSSSATNAMRGFSRNKHYSKKSSAALEAICGLPLASPVPEASTSKNGMANGNTQANGNGASEETSSYIEERYARNLSESQAPLAKIALRRRIAGVLRESANTESHLNTPHALLQDQQILGEDPVISQRALEKASSADTTLHPSNRGVTGLTESDVYLYPGGMSAIFHSFMTAVEVHKRRAESGKGKAKVKDLGKSVCFGFPYTDTLKILQKWGPGCEFFGKGLDSDLAGLEEMFKTRIERFNSNPDSTNPDDKPILCLICEFPSNPLLRSPDLKRIKDLADNYNVMIIIDETIGGFVNVECLPFADIVVSSLTKIFSGDSNVMGGSMTLNPASKHYTEIKEVLEATYEDTYYAADAIFMERNSRDFRSRVDKINKTTENLCDFLLQHTEKPYTAEAQAPVLTKVYYPKYITPENYQTRMRQVHLNTNGNTDLSSSTENIGAIQPGYGSLFSLTFTTLAASRAFFDALPCCKGPSLGTNFTLASPYTLLAHFLELDWARTWEVEEGLVRVSIGLESIETLLDWFKLALTQAENAVE